MKYVDTVAHILLIVGGINWGTAGVFDFNLVSEIFGQFGLSKVVYGGVGLSGVYELVKYFGLVK